MNDPAAGSPLQPSPDDTPGPCTPPAQPAAEIPRPAEPPVAPVDIGSPPLVDPLLTIPKTLPPPPVAVPPQPARVGAWLLTAVVATGVLQLLLTIMAPSAREAVESGAFKMGRIFGSTVVFPAVVIGLFSIGARFRNARSRAIILLCVWGLACFSAVQRMGNARQHAAVRELLEGVKGLPGLEAVESPEIARPDAGGEQTEVEDDRAPAADSAGAVRRDYDFSAGSHERLSALIEHAHESEYHDIVAAYARSCAARPNDARLALERVRFIEMFLYAEDYDIASASDDHDAAVAHLTRRFPQAPGTVLYQLERTSDEKLEAEVRPHRARVLSWPAAERAKFFLLRAEAADRRDSPSLARQFARDSFTADATPEAGLLLARALQAADQDAEAVDILQHPVFEHAAPWEKKQKMELLFALEEPGEALGLFAELRDSVPGILRDTDLALQLARAGEVDAARAIFADMPLNDWNRGDVRRARLRFEMEFGGAEHALRAYRDLRSDGILADPLLRDRLALFWKYPGLGWNADDFIGVVVLGLALALAFACPLLVFVPVHYWSLLRVRRGRTSAWPDARWGLRQAWMVFGLLAVAEVVAIWWYAPELLLAYLADEDATGAVESVLSMQALVWGAGAVILLVAWWRARAGPLLGAGSWGLSKAVGVGCAIMLILRMGLGMYLVALPGVQGLDLASAVSLEMQLYRELLDQVGALGMVLVVAGFVPLVEEMLFRGVLLQALARHIPFGWANLLQALGFAVMHDNVSLLPFFVAFGVACGVLTRRSGGLLASLALHASNNLLACIAVLRLPNHLLS